MKKLFYCSSMAVALLCGTTSCEEDNPFGNLDQYEQELAKEYIKTEAAISSFYSLVDEVMRDSTFAATDSTFIDGATVVRSGNQINIDYKHGAAADDGRTRQGSIELTQSGDYFAANSSIDASFNNFSVDNQKYSGSLMLQSLGNSSFEITAGNFAVGEVFTLSGTQAISWRSGFETLRDASDDLYQISGSMSGADTSSQSLIADIAETDPLLIDRSCKYRLVAGLVDMAVAADTVETEASLDFRGDDGCQNIVEITLMKEGSEIRLIHQFEGF